MAERMKSLDPDQLTIAANRSGQFKLIMSNSTIKVDTTWSDLQKGDDAEMADAQSEVSKRFKSVEIDLKSFLKLVSCQLPEHETELWIFSRACATFVVSVADMGCCLSPSHFCPPVRTVPHQQQRRLQKLLRSHHGEASRVCEVRTLLMVTPSPVSDPPARAR